MIRSKNRIMITRLSGRRRRRELLGSGGPMWSTRLATTRLTAVRGKITVSAVVRRIYPMILAAGPPPTPLSKSTLRTADGARVCYPQQYWQTPRRVLIGVMTCP
jgi:hypothetical protein